MAAAPMAAARAPNLPAQEVLAGFAALAVHQVVAHAGEQATPASPAPVAAEEPILVNRAAAPASSCRASAGVMPCTPHPPVQRGAGRPRCRGCRTSHACLASEKLVAVFFPYLQDYQSY